MPDVNDYLSFLNCGLSEYRSSKENNFYFSLMTLEKQRKYDVATLRIAQNGENYHTAKEDKSVQL